jgi:hypothetical protein
MNALVNLIASFAKEFQPFRFGADCRCRVVERPVKILQRERE